MKYRKHRGFHISEVGVGTYSLAGVYGAKDIQEFKEMINRAFELGVNFFDTSEAYGKAEEILGEVVRPFREEIFIATKVGIREGHTPSLSEEYVRKACEVSLERLQTDYIDLYQVHFNDPNTPIRETADALEELVDEGKIHHYGVCHLQKEVIKEYCEIGNPFSALVELSAVARESYGNLLALSRTYNLGIIGFSTTGRGLLTGRYKANHKFEMEDIRWLDPLFQRERLRSGLRIAEKIAQLGTKHNKTSTQVAIAWVLAQPGVVCALSGPSTVKHLEENVQSSGWSIPEEDLNGLESFLKKEDKWLRKEQRSSVKRILSKPTQESKKAFVDLIYVIETSMSLHLIAEKEVLPIFYELYALRKELAKKGIKTKLKNIQVQLRNLIPLD
jgi:aryl-alcohol dehydrogenase-like predicted oxidoreductase